MASSHTGPSTTCLRGSSVTGWQRRTRAGSSAATNASGSFGKPWTKVGYSGNSFSVHWRLQHGGDSELRRRISRSMVGRAPSAISATTVASPFPSREAITSHLSRKHQACVAAYLECLECPDPTPRYRTLIKSNLRSHQLTHRRLPCDDCGHVVRTVFQMQSHWQKRHWQIKLILASGSCDDCGRSFAKSSLANHVRVSKRDHRIRAPFFCDTCGILFYGRPKLITHLMICV